MSFAAYRFLSPCMTILQATEALSYENPLPGCYIPKTKY